MGPFQITAKLGEGGMGVVYAARDPRLRRTVALKVLRPERSDDDEHRRRLIQEARAAAAVAHPNIAVVHEVGEAEGRVYVAMELCAGRSLRRVLEEGRLPPARAIGVARQIAAGLACAHAAGIVHRDLKPENVMVADDGTVKILDFGLARRVATDGGDGETVSHVTEEGRVLGTPAYMSPEQARGGAVDRRSDVFSFGVVLYEMIAGARPFGGAATMDVLVALSRDEPSPPSDLAPGIPAALDRLVMDCLAKVPSLRPADGRALVDRIAAIDEEAPRADAPTPSAEAATPAPAGRRPRRLARFLGPAAIALAAAGAAGAWAARPHATTLADLPLPASPSREAVTEYAAGLRAARDGRGYLANEHLERALRDDPSLAPAELRLALFSRVHASGAMGAVRDHVRRAAELGASLTDRDRALLDAAEPCALRAPWDHAECERRLRAAVARWPDDEELSYELGFVLGSAGRFEDAEAEIGRALAADPRSARALALRATMALFRGDVGAAERDLDACLRLSPGASACVTTRAAVHEERGDCRAAEDDARAWIAAAPAGVAYHLLARAALACGRPLATVREALAQKWRRWPGRHAGEPADAIGLDLLAGDFEAAERRARAIADQIEGSDDEADHARAALRLIQILDETGRAGDAAQVAADFERRRAAWAADPRGNGLAAALDPTPRLVAAERAGGAITGEEAARRRDAWLARWEAQVAPAWRRHLWLHAYAAPAETPEDAALALAALPRYAPLPSFCPTCGLIEADVGRVYLLAGRPLDAIPPLRRAARSLRALDLPIDHTRAELALGEALEATGDRAGACAAYGVVLDRWGRARPPSRSAARARQRADALACPGRGE